MQKELEMYRTMVLSSNGASPHVPLPPSATASVADEYLAKQIRPTLRSSILSSKEVLRLPDDITAQIR